MAERASHPKTAVSFLCIKHLKRLALPTPEASFLTSNSFLLQFEFTYLHLALSEYELRYLPLNLHSPYTLFTSLKLAVKSLLIFICSVKISWSMQIIPSYSLTVLLSECKLGHAELHGGKKGFWTCMFHHRQCTFASHQLIQLIQNNINTYYPLNTKWVKMKLRALKLCRESKPATEIQR